MAEGACALQPKSVTLIDPSRCDTPSRIGGSGGAPQTHVAHSPCFQFVRPSGAPAAIRYTFWRPVTVRQRCPRARSATLIHLQTEERDPEPHSPLPIAVARFTFSGHHVERWRCRARGEHRILSPALAGLVQLCSRVRKARYALRSGLLQPGVIVSGQTRSSQKGPML